MPARRPSRRGLALALAASALILAGCEKPTPYVTVFSGDTVVKTEAQAFCFDDQSLVEQSCRRDDLAVPTLQVDSAGSIGIDVDKDLAESGWIPVVAGQRLEQQEEHYLRLQLPGQIFGDTGVARLQIIKVEDGEERGIWQFDLMAP